VYTDTPKIDKTKRRNRKFFKAAHNSKHQYLLHLAEKYEEGSRVSLAGTKRDIASLAELFARFISLREKL